MVSPKKTRLGGPQAARAISQAWTQRYSAGFVRGLKQRRYFTGNESAYTRNVTRIARNAMQTDFRAIG